MFKEVRPGLPRPFFTPQKLTEQMVSWIEIDAQAFAHNIKQYKHILAPHVIFAPVIKSNAYGHGLKEIAQLCEQNTLVDYLCVVRLQEAVYLRKLGIRKPILVLSILDDELEHIIQHNIDIVAYDVNTVHSLNIRAQRYKRRISVHIKIDTGLSRLGVLPEYALQFIQMVHQLPFISIKGLFTHFANSESTDQTFTNKQIQTFDQICSLIKEKDFTIPYFHSSCSASITANDNSHFNFARAGIGLYGLWPSTENKIITQQYLPLFSLKPVLSLKSRIIQLKKVSAESLVGYDCTYRTTTKETTIAILPIGYWDGYDRKLSNKGKVLIRDQLAPVIGRIAMNLITVDVSHVQSVQVGDEVTLIGDHKGITADDIAQTIDTINYEVVTKINPLLPRVVKK